LVRSDSDLIPIFWNKILLSQQREYFGR
jgi:hypothetical protein